MPAKKSGLRYQCAKFFLTYPHCDADPKDVLPQLGEWATAIDNGIHRYAIVQEFHKNGKPHLHIILCFNAEVDRIHPRAFDVVGPTKKWHGNYKSLVSEPHAFKYLSKEYDPLHNYTPEEAADLIERAKLPLRKPSKKNHDWAGISTRIMAGEDIQTLIDEDPSLFMHCDKIERNLAAWRRLKLRKAEKLKELKNVWYWGHTKAGKSKMVWDKHGDAYLKPKDQWWTDYDGEKKVHYSDVDQTHDDFLDNVKNIADWYPMKVPTKHGNAIMIRPEEIIVTSNYTIREVYGMLFRKRNCPWDEELVKAVERRFTEIYVADPVDPDPLNVFPPDYFLLPDCDADITYDKYKDPFDFDIDL